MSGAPSTARAATGGAWQFVAIWAGQLVSLVGSALTGFVLGVWVFQETGSAAMFAIIMIANVLPGIVLAPFAGVAADRWDRRRVLIVADLGAAAATAAVAVLLATGTLETWHVYLTTAVGASANAFHGTAFNTMIPHLVPKRHLGRANGLMQANMAAQIAAPLIAATLLATIGLLGVVVIDLVSAAFAVATLLVVRLPSAARTPGGGAALPSLTRGLGDGWRYLMRRPGLRWLVVVAVGGFNLLFAMAGVLVQPLILSFDSPSTLGVLMFAGGSGLFVGSLVMSAWGGPARKTRGVLLFMLVGGVALALHSLSPSPWLIAAAAPLFLFTLPLVNGCSMTIFQTKTDPATLGRVLATTRMVSNAALLGGYATSGLLADLVFEPLMRPDGALAGSVGGLIGVGEGRGIALVFLTVGSLMTLLAAAGYLQPRLRHLEDEVPDALPDTPAATPEPKREPGAETEVPATG